MPTAAKLLGAILFAALAAAVSLMTIPRLPENFAYGRMVEINAALGLILGWTQAGARAGRGWGSATGNGLTTSVVLALAALFVDSTCRMILLSLDKRYRGPMEAVMDVFEQMLEFGSLLIAPLPLIALLGGGFVIGWLLEAVALMGSGAGKGSGRGSGTGSGNGSGGTGGRRR